MTQWLRASSVGLLLLALVGCARGPDQARLQADVQQQLDALFGSRMLEVRALRRQGSAPVAAARDGATQAVVYYNAVLEFNAPYDPSDWSSLSPELIASALGATDEGVIGLAAGRIGQGTQIRAYGSMVYRRVGEPWQPATLPAQTPEGAATVARAPRATELIERLSGIVNTAPGLHAADDAIVAQELDQALQNIRLRLNRGDQQQLLVASGPAGGEYARFVESLRPRGIKWPVVHATTAGSIENALMIDAGKARFGIVQSDVAAAAVTGRAGFAAQGPLRHLRAVTALFPESVHAVVRSDGGPTVMATLRGKRIAVGSRGSGTRQTAILVLRAHGLEAGDYVPVDADSPGEALQLLTDGRVDVVIEVASAPWSQLSVAGSRTPLALVPLDAAAVAQLAESLPGLVPLAIPERTYAWQRGAVPTLAATALLVANAGVPDAEVRRVLDFLYASEQAARRGASASRLSRSRALAGVTLPLHDGAAAYFAAATP